MQWMQCVDIASVQKCALCNFSMHCLCKTLSNPSSLDLTLMQKKTCLRFYKLWHSTAWSPNHWSALISKKCICCAPLKLHLAKGALVVFPWSWPFLPRQSILTQGYMPLICLFGCFCFVCSICFVCLFVWLNICMFFLFFCLSVFCLFLFDWASVELNCKKNALPEQSILVQGYMPPVWAKQKIF